MNPVAVAQPEPPENHLYSFLDTLASLFVRIHSTVIKASDAYLQEHGRAVYLTPAKCMHALALFERLIAKRHRSWIKKESSTSSESRSSRR